MLPWTVTNPFGSLFVLLLWGALVLGAIMVLGRLLNPSTDATPVRRESGKARRPTPATSPRVGDADPGEPR